jgi:hypothetical protein
MALPGSTQFLFDLDPQDPSLDHHRPGGLPLFGTAMGIDAMIAAARRVLPPARSTSVESVRVLAPCILRHDGRHGIAVEFAPPSPDGCIRGRLVSPADGLPESIHFEACLRLGERAAVRPRHGTLPDLIETAAVNASEIYRVYFHGPAFRVIAAARVVSEIVVARMAADLDTAPIPPTARLVEFGLQTAGLLELAGSGRLMIPHRIGRIEPAGTAAITGPVFAVAGQSVTRDRRPCTDIEIVDATGTVVMRIDGYETVELSFSAATDAAAKLGDRLRTTASRG